MTGATTLLFVAFALLAPAPVPARTDPALEQLLAGLARTPPASETFHEIRHRRALRQPLVSTGTLTWGGGMDFRREVTAPYSESAQLQGDNLVVRRDGGRERTIPLTRAPELQVLFNGLSAMFAGDADAIVERFEVDLQAGTNWRLTLVPRERRLRERVDGLELLGEGDHARCLVMDQRGTHTLTLLGQEAAPAPAADFQATVTALCPAVTQ